jgi:hypothetical protein
MCGVGWGELAPGYFIFFILTGLEMKNGGKY